MTEIRRLRALDGPKLEELARRLGRAEELREATEALASGEEHLCLGLYREEQLTGAILAWLDNTLQHDLAEDVVLVDGILGEKPKPAAVKRLLNGVVLEMERQGLPELPLEVRLPGRWKLSPPPQYRRVWKREIVHPLEELKFAWWRFEAQNGDTDE